MSLPQVDQASLLANLFADALAEFRPAEIAVLGCAGGNGFDRIQPEVTRRIVGVDVNGGYLQVLRERHRSRLPGLELHAFDIQSGPIAAAPVDLVFAALIFEYVSLEAALPNVRGLCRPGGALTAVIQLPSKANVTPTPFLSIQSLSSAFRLVSPDDFLRAAAVVGFEVMSRCRVASAAGKEFERLTFRRVV